MIGEDRYKKIFSKYYFLFLKVFVLVLIYIGLRAALRVYVYETFWVPSDSMQPTLIPGDRVYVDKLAFGARLSDRKSSPTTDPSPSALRVVGLGALQRNDIIVFNLPVPYDRQKIGFKADSIYCKRCIALPGDTIGAVSGFFRNGATTDTLGCIESQRQLSRTPKSELQRHTYRTFPFNVVQYDWTIQNFGPLYVPQKGATIMLDSLNYHLYRMAIEYETGRKLTLKNGTVHLIGQSQPLDKYTFTENYYFVAGDNVLNSDDSRYWGFLPERHIIGIVHHITYSRSLTDGTFRLQRLLKRV